MRPLPPASPAIPPRASRGQVQPVSFQTETARPSRSPQEPAMRARRPETGWLAVRSRLLPWLMVGMGLALLWLCWLGPALGGWWQQQTAQYQYGTTRASQLDADIGHGGVSHLLAQDLHGTIVVLEVWPPSAHRPADQPLVSVCAFPRLLQEEPGSPPHVVELQQATLPGSHHAVILVTVQGVPFRLTCVPTATGLQAVGSLPGRWSL